MVTVITDRGLVSQSANQSGSCISGSRPHRQVLSQSFAGGIQCRKVCDQLLTYLQVLQQSVSHLAHLGGDPHRQVVSQSFAGGIQCRQVCNQPVTYLQVLHQTTLGLVAVHDDDDELMLNVLRCHKTY